MADDQQQKTDPLQLFIDLFPEGAAEQGGKENLADLPLEERLRKHIIDGEKKGLPETLDEAMEKYEPLKIINEHLLDGMKVVGELFGSGQMQLPFVLQSAEVMKMAVARLEPHMERIEGETKGTIILATVKGDVHDIGKNLVDIILSNNGYTVHNLGIKQPISDILKAFEEKKADAIGLSGLLVKSVNVMEENLREMVEQEIDVPVLLGGAALSRHYCDSYLRKVYAEGGGRVYHGKDAFEGLRIMDMLKEKRLDELDTEIEERLEKRAEAEKVASAAKEKKKAKEAEAAGAEGEGGAAVAVEEAPKRRRSDVSTGVDVPEPPFYGDRVVEHVALENVYPFVNKIALYRGQWMFKKGRMSKQEYQHFIEDKVDPVFDRLRRQCEEEEILHPKVVYGYWPCQSDGDELLIFDPEEHDREIERFSFPRQEGRRSLCIADFFKSVDSGQKDAIGFTCVTMGDEVSKRAKALFENDNYQEYLYLHGFGVECAEALAELWHKRVRQELGIDADDSPKISDLFTQKYRGSRYSPGYPACPEMSDQEIIFRLLEPQRIGCVLTENWQIDPEQSTSAFVVHHPEAKYFNV